jgi:hypothetical protein
MIHSRVLPSPHIPLLGWGLGPDTWFLAGSPGLLDFPYQPLTPLHNDELLLWGSPSKHDFFMVFENLVQLLWVHTLQLWAVDHNGFNVTEGKNFERLHVRVENSSGVLVPSSLVPFFFPAQSPPLFPAYTVPKLTHFIPSLLLPITPHFPLLLSCHASSENPLKYLCVSLLHFTL